MSFRQYQRAVGARVKKARWLAGWTQAQAAAESDLDFRYYCEIERGHANPTLETLFKVAHALRRRASELIEVESLPRGHVSLDELRANPPRTGRPPKPRRPRRT